MNKFLLLSFLIIHLSSYSQKKKCPSDSLLEKKANSNPTFLQNHLQLEKFTKQWIANNNAKLTNNQTIYTIPVVVHVVHNNEAVGVGSNISDAQIFSQINRLNIDFRKMNTDTLGYTHPFGSLKADVGIEFCLATVDPTGSPTNGIDRFQGIKADYTGEEFDLDVKPWSIWDHTKYLNIWTIPEFTIGSDWEGSYGYAYRPPYATPDDDGVVVIHDAFGDVGNLLNPGLSRTVTHEVGHYFNLFHIWGTGSLVCKSDSVDDTPPSVEANYECPIFPQNPFSSCNSDEHGEMFMNYMDYTDDSCITMFTKGQASRMRAALEGARASLLSSTVCGLPASVKKNTIIKTNIYPNPTHNQLTINSNAIIKSIDIIDLYGRLVLNYTNHNFSRQLILNNINIDSGMYLVKINLENASIAMHQIHFY